MNPLSAELHTGTLGELLVQLRLLQHDVQSVAPHKDTGNDLLAIKGEVFRAIQVKTSIDPPPFRFDRHEVLHRSFHLLALVLLVGEGRTIHLDRSAIYLLKRDEVTKGYFTADDLRGLALDQRVGELFQPTAPPNTGVDPLTGAPTGGGRDAADRVNLRPVR